jgi:hypothetical protein
VTDRSIRTRSHIEPSRRVMRSGRTFSNAESSAPAVIIQEIYETTRLVFRSLRSVSEERMA